MISIQEIDKLPNICGLYLVVNSDGKVIYIGQAIDIYQRWAGGHHRLSDIIKYYGVNASIRWVKIPQHRLNHAEYLAVKFYQPFLNRRMPPIV